MEISLRFIWELFEISLRFLWDFFEICLRFVWDLFEIYFRFVWDLFEICLRYLRDLFEEAKVIEKVVNRMRVEQQQCAVKISLRFILELFQISLIFIWDFFEIYFRFISDFFEIYLRRWWIEWECSSSVPLRFIWAVQVQLQPAQ